MWNDIIVLNIMKLANIIKDPLRNHCGILEKRNVVGVYDFKGRMDSEVISGSDRHAPVSEGRVGATAGRGRAGLLQGSPLPGWGVKCWTRPSESRQEFGTSGNKKHFCVCESITSINITDSLHARVTGGRRFEAFFFFLFIFIYKLLCNICQG